MALAPREARLPLLIVTHNGAGPVAFWVPQVFVTLRDLSFVDRITVPLDRGPEMTIKLLLIVGEKKPRRSIASIDNTIDSQKSFPLHLSLKDGSLAGFRPMSLIPCRHPVFGGIHGLWRGLHLHSIDWRAT